MDRTWEKRCQKGFLLHVPGGDLTDPTLATTFVYLDVGPLGILRALADGTKLLFKGSYRIPKKIFVHKLFSPQQNNMLQMLCGIVKKLISKQGLQILNFRM